MPTFNIYHISNYKYPKHLNSYNLHFFYICELLDLLYNYSMYLSLKQQNNLHNLYEIIRIFHFYLKLMHLYIHIICIVHIFQFISHIIKDIICMHKNINEYLFYFYFNIRSILSAPEFSMSNIFFS